jgi:hypothetical protein
LAICCDESLRESTVGICSVPVAVTIGVKVDGFSSAIMDLLQAPNIRCHLLAPKIQNHLQVPNENQAAAAEE